MLFDQYWIIFRFDAWECGSDDGTDAEYCDEAFAWGTGRDSAKSFKSVSIKFGHPGVR